MRRLPSIVTSISGTFGAPLTLTTSGGSGTGAVTYVVDAGGTATGCVISAGSAELDVSVGTCIVTATKAADGNYLVASSALTTITLGSRDPDSADHHEHSRRIRLTSAASLPPWDTIGGGVKSVTSNSPAVCTWAGRPLVTFIELGLAP